MSEKHWGCPQRGLPISDPIKGAMGSWSSKSCVSRETSWAVSYVNYLMRCFLAFHLNQRPILGGAGSPTKRGPQPCSYVWPYVRHVRAS